MIGIVIVTHGSVGEELLKTCEMIIGKQDKVVIISMGGGSALADIADALEAAIKEFEKVGCLVFTDMFGGSPSNIAMAYLGTPGVEVVSGLNVPMMIKALSMRMENEDVTAIGADSARAGRESIIVAGELMKKRA